MPLDLDWNLFLDPLVLPSLKSFIITASPQLGHSLTFSPAMISLLIRSKCSLNSFEIGYGMDMEVHPDIIQLLQRMPNLMRFTSRYISSPSFMDIVQNGLLQSLEAVTWTVKPEGFCALLDLLEDHISRPISSSPQCHGAVLSVLNTPGLSNDGPDSSAINKDESLLEALGMAFEGE